MYGQQIFASARENTRYAYAVGRIRALETRLLDAMAIGRLLEAESAREVLKMLSEGEYENSLSDIREAADFEMGLNVERERVYTLIDELSLDPQLTQVFRIRWDFHNLKVLMKSSYLGESGFGSNDVLVSSGLISIEDLRSVVESEDGQGSRGAGERGSEKSSIENVLEDARVQYEESRNPQMIDIVIDNHLQSFLYQRAADYPNTFLCGYLEAVADLTNIKSFIRIKMLDENVRLLDAVLLPHGSLQKEIFLRHFDETVENLATFLSNTPYAELAAEGIRRWAEEHSLAAYERLSDNYLIDYIKPAKYIVFGVEPLVGYLLAKEHEMKLIRIIVIGKLNDLPTEAIKERLRDTYV
jgi:V/A-type H+-transporting ATPase subunit C